MRGLMMDQPMLISNMIEWGARFHGSQEIITRTTEGDIHRYTLRDSLLRIKKLANALKAAGIGHGDRVATIAWNNYRHFEIYFAVSGIGAVLHTINPRVPPPQMAYMVGHAEDKMLFFDTTFAPLAKFLSAKAPGIETFISMTDAENAPDEGIEGMLNYESFIADHADTFDWPIFNEHDAATICYTSGTTGNPKGVVYSHRSTTLHSFAAALPDSLNLSAQDVLLPVVPMFHVNAWGTPYAAAMTGARMVLPGPGLDGAPLYELISQEKCTNILGVPTVWLRLLNYVDENGLSMDSVKRVVIGGSAAPASMIERFEQYGVDVIHAWGMTEMSPLGTANQPLVKHVEETFEEKIERKTKQGRPVFGVDMRLVNDKNDVLPHDGKTSGHLQVRGPWIASEYFKVQHSESHTPDGWFFTGDIATIDEDGYMQITDRSKDVIKSGGEWISSIALENAAMSHSKVAQAAVIGMPHEKWDERPMLIVVPVEGETVTLEDMNAFLLSHGVIKWWLPDAMEVVDALPLGSTGKVLKTALREQFLGGE